MDCQECQRKDRAGYARGRRCCMELKGKGALVTGASKGLGAALAAELARVGARIALVARGAGELSRVAAEIRATGGEAHALPANVADKRAAHAIAGSAAALVGPIELLIHNASTLGPVPLRLLLDTDCEDLDHVLEVNLVGPFRLTKIVAGAMALRGSGLVLHVSRDRKSTRLNSSHMSISYAVIGSKKKKKIVDEGQRGADALRKAWEFEAREAV